VSVVTIGSLSKSYGRTQALRDVSLEIGEGVTGLLGPNGAGKSTLLLCVLGLLPDWRGHVRVLGLDAREQRTELRRRVGFMPETDAYLPDMTAIRAVRFLGRLSGMPYDEALRRAHEVLYHVGLGEAVYRDLREYSTGMRQRFKLAQALVHDPEIIFLDEPLAGMDPEGRDDLLALIRDLAVTHGKHVVWSSHILPEVQKVADGVLVLHLGRCLGSFRLEDLGGEEGRYAVEVEGDAESFRAYLQSRGIAHERAPGSAREEADLRIGRTSWTLHLGTADDAGDVLRWGREIGVRVRKITPAYESLEDVFHRLLGDGEED
jgi:ABC-2 type transport system ATP-binding protein